MCLNVGHHGKAMVEMMVIGRRENIPDLLVLLNDAYQRRRMEVTNSAEYKQKQKKRRTTYNLKQFIKESPFCQRLNEKERTRIYDALHSYNYHICPDLNLGTSKKKNNHHHLHHRFPVMTDI